MATTLQLEVSMFKSISQSGKDDILRIGQQFPTARFVIPQQKSVFPFSNDRRVRDKRTLRSSGLCLFLCCKVNMSTEKRALKIRG